MLTLTREMTYRLKVKGPLRDVKTPEGTLQYWEMTEGRLEGARIKASIVMPGGDWYRVGTDGYGRPDVRTQLETDDGAIVLLRYTGLVETNEVFTRAAEQDRETQFDDAYMRMCFRFDTDDPRYAWLTSRLWIARGRLHGKNDIEYEVYRVD
jgi:hypothetical protein